VNAAPLNPVVSVVVPAYNAVASLAETLESALAQTVHDVEILVVNDGSSDQTSALTLDFARRDPRVRLVEQPNGGVARARNRGVSEARGRFIAPLDADDLWHPTKLARQLEALRRAGPRAGLAYNWSRIIDEHGRVISSGARATISGYALHRHIMWNFIGNGSTPLVAAELLREVGYEPSLRDSRRQGAEDYMMQLQVAQRCGFACAPGYLTGYRQAEGTMSCDLLQMNRSVSGMFALLAERCDSLARKLVMKRRAEYLYREAEFHLENRHFLGLSQSLLECTSTDPLTTGRWLLHRFDSRMKRGLISENESNSRHFKDIDPDAPSSSTEPAGYRKNKAQLEAADEARAFSETFA